MVSFKSPADTPGMPRKSTAFVPRYQKFESISLQRESRANFGNILRHEYAGVSAPVMWKLVQDDLAPLEEACCEELAREQAGVRHRDW